MKKSVLDRCAAARRGFILLGAGLLACPAISPAASFTWNGSTTTGFGFFDEHDNWVGNVAPPTSGADLIFGATNTHGYTPTLEQPYSINSLTFNSSALALLGGGTAIVAPFSATSLNVSNGILQISPSGSVLEISSLTVGATSKLDLTSDAADMSGGTLSSITDLAKLGYANGTWNGSGGITSSTAAANIKHLTAIGVIQNNQSGTALYNSSHQFLNTTPGAGDILAAYTYYGDANLDGKVTSSDYTNIDYGYLTHAAGWFNGDFNYDGVVNGSDYTLIDNAFNTQGAVLDSELSVATAQIGVGAGSSSVPEPKIVSLLLMGTAGLLGRRRGRLHRR